VLSRSHLFNQYQALNTASLALGQPGADEGLSQCSSKYNQGLRL
jgi:hypothetical protein